MRARDLYVSRGESRFGPERLVESPLYTVIGVPFDSTSSYRPGQRFAPLEIRRAAYNIEWNSLFLDHAYLYDVDLEDAGDLGVVHGDAKATLQRLSNVVEEEARTGRVPIVIGGEHLVTYGVIEGLTAAGVKPCMVVFDAHFDMRMEYLGVKYSHATVMRRIMEKHASSTIYYVGVRAWEREELEYATSKPGVRYDTSMSVKRLGPLNVLASLRRSLASCEKTYLSIDMDAVDPAYAPGVANPEPLGLTPMELLQLVYGLASDARLAGLDLVEVSPPYDPSGSTSVLAARILVEALILNQLARRGVKLPVEPS